jgi:hypothetical protein
MLVYKEIILKWKILWKILQVLNRQLPKMKLLKYLELYKSLFYKGFIPKISVSKSPALKEE